MKSRLFKHYIKGLDPAKALMYQSCLSKLGVDYLNDIVKVEVRIKLPG